MGRLRFLLRIVVSAAALLPALGRGVAAPIPAHIADLLRKSQCEACHQDNGVASATRFKFPLEDTRSLAALIDRASPEASRLLTLPTNRVPHPGGERIKRGSADEQTLAAWVRTLATAAPIETAAGPADSARRKRTLLRRLTHSQYNNTVADLLGDQTRPARNFPTEDFAHGFTNVAEAQSISPLQAEAYAAAAAKVARNAARSGKLREISPCKSPTAETTAACAAKFVAAFGKAAFRRPVDGEEAARLARLLVAEASRGNGHDFWSGAQLVVEAMLQSPGFLFRAEPGQYGVASRLAYLLWNSTPDAALVRLADTGALKTRAQIEAASRRLLADDRAHASLDEFAAEWLRFDRVRTAIRERKLFPEFGTELAAAMTEETSRLFQHLVWENRDFRELFSAGYSFLNASLAQLYGLPAPEREFSMVKFPADSRRAGILGHASFLTMTSKPQETSPTERGIFIREHFLCQNVPPPPPGVDPTLPAIMEDRPMSNRERLGIHLSNPSCAGCHRLVDPIGFGLEQFDAIGRYREKQVALVYPVVDKRRGVRREGIPVEIPVNTAATIVGLKGAEFSSPAEAGRILAGNPTCQRCVVKQYFRYAMNRPESADDQPAIDAILERFRKSGFKFQELMLGVVTSDPFLEEFADGNK